MAFRFLSTTRLGRFLKRRFVRLTLQLALLHYLLLVILNSFLYLLSYLPPLEKVLIAMTYVDQFLRYPRRWLRHLWLSEYTPTTINILLTIATSLVWGLVLARLWTWYRAEEPVKPLLS